MMRVIIGHRQSGKTFELFKQCEKYFKRYPHGEIMFISNTARAAEDTKMFARKLVESCKLDKTVLDRTLFVSWNSYARTGYVKPRYVSDFAVCIDDVDELLRMFLGDSILAISSEPYEEIHL